MGSSGGEKGIGSRLPPPPCAPAQGAAAATASGGVILRHPLEAKKSRYASRRSSVVMAWPGLSPCGWRRALLGAAMAPKILETTARFPDRGGGDGNGRPW